ncbi:MAG: SMP-30/gluconolactonase/LRE family protein [Acetobacteraceae bacterium]|nr:SMP-30/gluconolactonase/LRE family protein [Acetobacteraceae bacterium]
MAVGASVSVEVELVLDAKASTGECPTWSEREGVLYWTDIEEPALHRFDPRGGDDRVWPMPAQMSAFALCRSGRVLVALRTGLAVLDPASGALRSLAPPPYDPRTHRFNDGKCDREGRFWVGVMRKPLPGTEREGEDGPERGHPARPLHVFDAAAGLAPVDAYAVIGNGLAWSPDHRTLYFTDTEAGEVRCFDFDAGAGAIANPRVLARFAPEEGRPDGAAVDTEGGYWCALYGGGRLVRLDPVDGRVEREIALPVSQPTMCAFGGPGLDTLDITSASDGLDPEARAREPLAGGLFRCRPGFRGMPVDLFAD